MSDPVNNNQTSSRGRVLKKVGMDDKKQSALEKLRELKSGSLKRTDQYEVSIYIFTFGGFSNFINTG